MKRKSCLLFSVTICTAMTFSGMLSDTAHGASLLYWQNFDNPETTTTVATPAVTPGGGNLGVSGVAQFSPTGGIFGGVLNTSNVTNPVNPTAAAGTTFGSGTSLSNLGTMNQFTITLWVNVDTFRTGALNATDHRILTLGDSGITDYCCDPNAKGVGIALRNDTTDRINPRALDVLVNGRSATPFDGGGNPNGIPGTTTTADKWTFIALTYDGSSPLANNSTIQSAATGGLSSLNGQLYMGTDVAAVTRFALPFGATHGDPTGANAGPIAFGATDARLILANRTNPNRGLDGYIDDIRLYGGVLTAAEVEAVRSQGIEGMGLSVEVNRITGNIRLLNNTGSAINNIVGYSITTTAGTLNSSDAVWNAIGDTNPSWTELAAAGGGDISEINLFNNSPVTLASSGTMNFGNVWYRHYNEDLQMELAIDDGSPNGLFMQVPVKFTGGSGAYPKGDINFDGVVDAADVVKFAQYIYQPLAGTVPGATYAFGDMNGDLVSDYQDILAYRTIFDSLNGPGAFNLALTSVPEPSALWLGGLAVGALVVVRRQRFARSLAMLCIGIGCASAATSQAAVVFQENFDTIAPGSSVTTGNSAFTLAAPAAVAVVVEDDANDHFSAAPNNRYLLYVDNNGTTGNAPRLTGPANLTQAKGFEMAFDFRNPRLVADPNRMRVILEDASGTPTIRFTLEGTYFAVVPDVSHTYELGTTNRFVAVGNYGSYPILYNGGADWVVPGHFDLWHNGVQITNDGPMDNLNLKTTQISIRGAVASTADFQVDNLRVEDTVSSFSYQGDALLTLEVNTSTGQMSIKNPYSQFAMDIDFYRISGPAGAINVGGWNSLDAQQGSTPNHTGWFANPGDSSSIVEFTVDGSQRSITSGSSVSLGTAFNTASGAGGSLLFEYAIDGGKIYHGTISLVTSSTLFGDFNNDGIVNLADYTVWRDNLGAASDSVINNAGDGSPGVTAADYNVWKSNFGASAGSLAGVSTSVIPEPASMLLLGLGGVGLMLRRRVGATLRRTGIALATLAVMINGSVDAAVTVQRAYTLGDYSQVSGHEGLGAGNGPDGGQVGSSFGSPFDVLNSIEAQHDLAKFGDPRYHQITSADTTNGHPGSVGSYGISFDGASDRLHVSTAYNVISSSTSQGMQLWVLPDSAKIGEGSQVIAYSSTNAGGPAIDANGNWSQISSGHVVIAGSVPVVGDQWHHINQHIYLNTDTRAPRVVPSTGAVDVYTSVIYVNGVAVAANNDSNASASNGFGIGGYTVGEVGSHYFQGVIDEVEVYSSTADSFNLFADNDYIAGVLADVPGGFELGDINLNGTVDMDDANLFITNWYRSKVLAGAHNSVYVGDLETYGWGDLNLDGIVNLRDGFLLRSALNPEALAAFDQLLLSTLGSPHTVPEPASVLLLLAAVGMGTLRLRSSKSRTRLVNTTVLD